MTTDLPEPGLSGEEEHAAMSRRFLEHATMELDKGNRLQASEKVWGAVAHALKAVAERRGWDHEGHQNLIDISGHLGKEFGRTRDFYVLLSSARSVHTNFYENEIAGSEIRESIGLAEEFVDQLAQIRDIPPRPFTIDSTEEQARVRRLLNMSRAEVRERCPIGTTDSHGFSRNPEDNGSGASDSLSPAAPRSPEGPSSTSRQERMPGTPKDEAATPGEPETPGPTGRQRRGRASVARLSKPKPALPPGSRAAVKPKPRIPSFFNPPRLPRKRQ